MRSILVAGVIAANLAFIGLGIVFGYPDVLAEPPTEILARFAADQSTVTALFLLLALGAGSLIPVAVLLGRRLQDSSAAALSVHVGVLAGLVQVIGLLRWPFAVPALAHAADRVTAETIFTVLHSYLGSGLGETLGYLLTGAWTILVLRALPAPRWFIALGAVSAVAILSGLLIPLDVPGTDLANFLGYLAWSVWMICLAVRAGKLQVVV
ncbi:DUF4386 family protein [Rhizohabitans arisaemae]|uniref:DUF4386 family protein n=1 Tax=Rhizohabitans arisaemae TaxID=2720610 RepID=UPI0024B26976|nr:DUF4386 family protein [Rhizohabitans arisaemae]